MNRMRTQNVTRNMLCVLNDSKSLSKDSMTSLPVDFRFYLTSNSATVNDTKLSQITIFHHYLYFEIIQNNYFPAFPPLLILHHNCAVLSSTYLTMEKMHHHQFQRFDLHNLNSKLVDLFLSNLTNCSIC